MGAAPPRGQQRAMVQARRFKFPPWSRRKPGFAFFVFAFGCSRGRTLPTMGEWKLGPILWALNAVNIVSTDYG